MLLGLCPSSLSCSLFILLMLGSMFFFLVEVEAPSLLVTWLRIEVKSTILFAVYNWFLLSISPLFPVICWYPLLLLVQQFIYSNIFQYLVELHDAYHNMYRLIRTFPHTNPWRKNLGQGLRRRLARGHCVSLLLRAAVSGWCCRRCGQNPCWWS
jgi:hypothetical protein